MEGGYKDTRWEGYVDWRNRPALRGKHGGMLAASFTLVLENLAYLANASNRCCICRSTCTFHRPKRQTMSPISWELPSFWPSLEASYLTLSSPLHIYLISALIEILGLIILTIQARTPSLKPPQCNPSIPCEEVGDGKAAMLFVGLYLVALGVGGIKGSLPTHGAEQLDETPQKEGSKDPPSSTTLSFVSHVTERGSVGRQPLAGVHPPSTTAAGHRLRWVVAFIATTGAVIGLGNRLPFGFDGGVAAAEAVRAVGSRVEAGAAPRGPRVSNPRVPLWSHVDRWIVPDPTAVMRRLRMIRVRKP
ncbi:Protein NRT1/ PTR FAMILY 4.6 [Hibiscus syriacus]|uniref:Protein NRT1/ PTR FAMILY 4.6 n=1 Tax=Hibiscus syriacus TaxID=106335 RepID=A0A6A2W9C8_HIBSY|nr:Protein NRT1/ PTR FAMILY 4.6 [Hibiscus syriacus]